MTIAAAKGDFYFFFFKPSALFLSFSEIAVTFAKQAIEEMQERLRMTGSSGQLEILSSYLSHSRIKVIEIQDNRLCGFA
jgi:hypothetical protein